MKQKTFLWKILNGALPIGSERKKRNLGERHHCPLCYDKDNHESAHLETLEHLFRDCSFASHLWKGCSLGLIVTYQSNIPITEWISNWQRFLGKHNGNMEESYFVFLAVLEAIWEARNNTIFTNTNSNPIGAIKRIKHKAALGFQAYNSQMVSRIKNSEDDPIEPPGFEKITNKDQDLPGTLFLIGDDRDCDLARLSVDRRRGPGNLIHWHWNLDDDKLDSHRREAIRGQGNDTAAMLQAIHHGMEAAISNNLRHLQVYCQDQKAADWIQTRSTGLQSIRQWQLQIRNLLPLFHCLCFNTSIVGD